MEQLSMSMSMSPSPSSCPATSPAPPHFMVVTLPAQGHINPALHLAKLIARLSGARVTFSTAVSGHRRMFPSLSSRDEVITDGDLTYIPFADGSSDDTPISNDNDNNNGKHIMSQIKLHGSQHLASILRDLNAGGRPVSCIIYTMLLEFVGDIAGELGIPSALYWIQAATVLAIYHRFFHGYDALIAANGRDPTFAVDLPGLPLLQIRDLPSFLTITDSDDPFSIFLSALREMFDAMDSGGPAKPKVLVNTFDELEPRAIAAMEEQMELITIGPVVPETTAGSLFEMDEKEYIEWMDAQPERSVVYVSFGSLIKMSREDVEEIRKGLREIGRPYLWVVRKDNRCEDVELEELEEEEEEEERKKRKKKGMVVEWCAQRTVLAHRALGCFVTHCGWNSTLESLIAGVPVVAAPKFSDQGTAAWMMERDWGTAVRCGMKGDRWIEAAELKRCVEAVMGKEGGGKKRRKAEEWKERAKASFGEGGSSVRNLTAFVKCYENNICI